MSEQHTDEVPVVPQRRSTELTLARVEAKLDVAIALHSARLEEHTRRITTVESMLARHDERLGAVERQQAGAIAAEAAQAAAEPPRVGPLGWVSFVISVLLALYVVLDHMPTS